MSLATFAERFFTSPARRPGRHEHLSLEFSGGNYLIHTYDSPGETPFIEVRIRLRVRWSDATPSELRCRSLLLHHGRMMDGFPPYLFEFEPDQPHAKATAGSTRMQAKGDHRLVLVARKYYPQGIPAPYLDNLPLRIKAHFRETSGETAELRGGIGSSGKAVLRGGCKPIAPASQPQVIKSADASSVPV
ncbi:MAG TPA: hypothetical protein VEG30_11045 [Terriglobales bacterium]|nr:hypothetical protein [Terriglobales bacterium]